MPDEKDENKKDSEKKESDPSLKSRICKRFNFKSRRKTGTSKKKKGAKK